jgi:uncharacterized membrane protein YhaH (DUF805 family)
MNVYLDVLKKYTVFDGRAGLKEYWMFVLFNIIISFVLGVIEGMLGTFGVLGFLYSLAIFLPGLGVSIRRLHDTDRSGWFVLIGLIPILGWIAIIILMALPGTEGNNKYGSVPQSV